MDKTIHLGRMLQQYLNLKHQKRTTAAEMMGMHQTAFYAFEKKPSMQTNTLLRLCHGLKYNFFMDVANSLPGEYAHGQLIASEREKLFVQQVSEREQLIAQLQEDNKKLKFENELMKGLMLGRKS